MSQLVNVTVERKANIYFDGNVTSRTLVMADGTRKTLGIMLPGEYEFGTDVAEIMEITAGALSVRLPGSDEWVAVGPGGRFQVPGGARFGVRVTDVVDYCCSYAG
jgi:uncharacterized protein YaiE (UPF0345 family)